MEVYKFDYFIRAFYNYFSNFCPIVDMFLERLNTVIYKIGKYRNLGTDHQSVQS